MSLLLADSLIVLATLLTVIVGSNLAARNMAWYRKLKLPRLAPSGAVIGSAWTTIFILAAASAILVWNLAAESRWIASLFLLNAALNVGWTYLFFEWHWLAESIAECALVEASVLLLIIVIAPVSWLAAVLLVPYALWVAFATHLTYGVWMLNARRKGIDKG